ncbi:MAG: replication-associated recombination protein A [Candidatus Krumholzibacteria bacterium]|nr:replication-associated recombination protein A [Candidatus Krumholzibacteria bacterium]
MDNNLFESNDAEIPLDQVPLADRMRPVDLSEVVGQTDLVGKRGPLRLLLQADALPSLLLWGPPGCGKTTLARLVAGHTAARFLEYSAVAVGTKELKAVMADAQRLKRATGTRTILFLDEIHRFNKAQQDALLPWVERGDVTLIGATTENPSFEVNSALISRTRLFVLSPLKPADVRQLLARSLTDERGLGGAVHLTDDGLDLLAQMSEGDARAALGQLETVALAAKADGVGAHPEGAVDAAKVAEYIQTRAARYDKGGDEHFNIISALHKSMRNSDVNAALYWLTRMLEGGEDPLYIARRVVRFASEDIGLAEPGALRQALDARDAVHFLGLPEGALALAQAVVFMALSPKSNALYKGYRKASGEVARGHNPPVPLHLRNASTSLMKTLGHGDGYVYAPDTADGMADMSCLPDTLRGTNYFEPGQRGFEAELAARMDKIQRWHQRRREQAGNTPEED